MKINSHCAFGKLERDQAGNIIAWHSLIDHLIDVAACFQRLCQCHSIQRAMTRTAQRQLKAQDFARLTVLVFLHDLGKANSGFQAKRWSKNQVPRGWPNYAGHGLEALKLFAEETFLQTLLALLPIDALCTWGESVEALLKASISHHGRPIIENPGDWSRAIWKPVIATDAQMLYDPAVVLREIGQRVIEIYPDAFSLDGDPLPDAPAFGHLFAGLVQLADWLGSDTAFFPMSNGYGNRVQEAPNYANRAVIALGLDAASWQIQLKKIPPDFASLFDGHQPYLIQTAMTELELGSLVVLESETGSGKTEAALWRFIHLFQRGEVDSLYFALPTRVSATQIYARILKVITLLWPMNAPLTVRALPGYSAADGQQPQALPDFKVLWADEPTDQEAHRRWAAESPKRFLAAPIAVGTIDQALFSTLQVRHAHLRHTLLSRSFLIIDEVHASDPYMTALSESLLQAHLGCGGHALLLSATLGSTARSRYLAIGQGVKSAPSSFNEACTAPYPALSDHAAMREIVSTIRSKTVTWSVRDIIDDPDSIAQMAIEAAAHNAKVLIVRNTVPAALAVFHALEQKIPKPEWLLSIAGVQTLHHGRFSREDRPLLDAAVQAQLGKHRQIGSLIVIGTQTLEQSLDLDADVLITDICPMDVLLQRIGRLHRHLRPPEERPEAYRSPQALILTPLNHDLSPLLKTTQHGLGPFRDGEGIYPDLRTIEATRRLIIERATITIPQDNRILVESATHPERLQALELLGEDWAQLGQKIEGQTGAKRTLAYLHRLEFNKSFDEIQAFPDDLDIATRLGIKDRLLNFNPAPIGPFGQPLKQLTVRHFLVKGIDVDTQPSAVENHDGVILFNLGNASFRYSRIGLERINN